MELVLISLVVIGLVYYFVVIRNGNLSFWKKAHRYPDIVYKEIQNDNAWVIDNGQDLDKKGLDGPFRMYVPDLDRIVKFYGRVGVYEESQKRIEEELDQM